MFLVEYYKSAIETKFYMHTVHITEVIIGFIDMLLLGGGGQ